MTNLSGRYRINKTITGAAPLYLRVKRQGDVWTESYSYDGQNWIVGGSYTYAMIVTGVGLHSSNAGPNPAHTASIDYFFNTQSPIIDEDSSTNNDPEIAVAPQTCYTATVNEVYSCDINATDSDGDTLIYSLDASPPAGMTIDENTGYIQWTPSFVQLGNHSVTVLVDDGNEGRLFWVGNSKAVSRVREWINEGVGPLAAIGRLFERSH